MPARKYLPACILRLKVRLEDFIGGGDDEAASEDEPFDEKLKRIDAQLGKLRGRQAQLRAIPEGTDQATLTRVSRRVRRLERARRAREDEVAQAAAQTLEQGDAFSIDIVTVPQSMNISLNGSRIADTISATFPFRDAPLVSDIIRACEVDVLAGTVPLEDFATPDRWRLSLARTSTSILMFRGYVDSWETSHGDDDATIDIEARSLESILIDGKINALSSSFKVDGAGEKISTYVNRILSKFPPTSGNTGGDQLRAAWYGASEDSEPTLSRRTLNRSLMTAQSRGKANGSQVAPAASTTGGPGSAVGPAGQPRTPQKTPGQEMSIWDLITQACNLSGCVPIYDPSLPERDGIDPANTILLRPPQTIFEEVDGGLTIPGGPADGFERTFDGVTSQVRFLVWGHNISEIKTSRKLGRIKAPGVEVRSYNPDAPPGERLLKVRYPERRRGTRIGAKGEAKVDEIVTRVVRGIRDTKILKQIAVGLYHAISRQELSVKINTDDLASYIDPTSSEEHNDNPDLLRMRPGSPCRVTVAREVKDPEQGLVLSPLSEIFERRTSEISRFLREQFNRFQTSLDPQAQADRVQQMTDRIAQALAAAKLTDLFYCRALGHDWNVEDGWASEVELVNFLEARSLPKNLGNTDQADDAVTRLVPKVKAPDKEARESSEEALARLDSIRRLL